jgi:hypothetical protein
MPHSVAPKYLNEWAPIITGTVPAVANRAHLFVFDERACSATKARRLECSLRLFLLIRTASETGAIGVPRTIDACTGSTNDVAFFFRLAWLGLLKRAIPRSAACDSASNSAGYKIRHQARPRESHTARFLRSLRKKAPAKKKPRDATPEEANGGRPGAGRSFQLCCLENLSKR